MVTSKTAEVGGGVVSRLIHPHLQRALQRAGGADVGAQDRMSQAGGGDRNVWLGFWWILAGILDCRSLKSLEKPDKL